MKLIFEPKTAERLYKISSVIVDRIFLMGGYKALYFSAKRCNFVFPNGKPCLDNDTLSPSVDCPLCKGSGVIYDEPIETTVLATDQPNNIQRQNEGIFFKDTIKLIVKADLPVKLLKNDTGTGRIFLMRDKFSIYSSSNNIWHTVYVDSEPRDIWLAGILYKTFSAGVHVISEREAIGNREIQIDNIEKIMTNTPAENINDNSLFTEDNVKDVINRIITNL